MRTAVLLLMLVACEPEPGETKCRTTMVYGTAVTKCKTGAPLEPVSKPTGYWCWTRPMDDIGLCLRQIGACEASRITNSSSGPSSTSGECVYFDAAVCAEGGCGPNIRSCSLLERQQKRGPDACEVRR